MQVILQSERTGQCQPQNLEFESWSVTKKFEISKWMEIHPGARPKKAKMGPIRGRTSPAGDHQESKTAPAVLRTAATLSPGRV